MQPLSSPDRPSASLFDRLNAWLRTSALIKLFVIGFLLLILLIPTGMLQSLVAEREATRNQAIDEVSSKWGGPQTIGGPVLTVPYLDPVRNEKGTVLQMETRYAHFLPDLLQIDGTVVPEKRNRGIFIVMLYNTKLRIRGTFRRPAVESLGLSPQAMQWNKAFLSLGISDMKGIRDAVQMDVNGRSPEVSPGVPTSDILTSGVSVPVALDADSYLVDCSLNLNGSTQLNFLPFGKETTVRLQSSWNTPSFTGSFLPEQREVNPEGFKASWRVLQFNRNYPQQGVGNFLGRLPEPAAQTTATATVAPPAADTSFGVKLLLPVDEYQKTTRSVKYAAMFIILTFTAFFFIEILAGRRIHPIQYLLVGFAICLFYLLLLAISEHLSFDRAYLIGSLVILLLTTFYVRYVFRSGRLTMLFSGMLALLYGFFYSLLRLEDYSLLLGSLGLLLILGTIMYLTRRVDWYRTNEAVSA